MKTSSFAGQNIQCGTYNPFFWSNIKILKFLKKLYLVIIKYIVIIVLFPQHRMGLGISVLILHFPKG